MKSAILKKIVLFGIVSGAITLMLACIGFGIVEFYKIHKESMAKLKSQADILVYNLQSPLLFDDKEAAYKTLLSVQDDKSINRVQLYKVNGQEFGSFIRANKPWNLKVSRNIMYERKQIGRLEIYAIYLGIRDKYIAYFLISLLIMIVSIPAAYFISEPIRSQVAEGVVQMEQQSDRLRLLANELSEIEQRERKRFARLLHDHLQQLLVAAKLRIDLLEKKIDKVTKQDLINTRNFVEQAINAARSLTTELRPPVLYEGGLAPAFGFLARKFKEQYNFKVDLKIDAKAEPSSDIIKWMLYTAVEELLLNTVKYAGVHECSLTLDVTDDRVLIRVVDKGKGFDPNIVDEEKKGGFGLFSIRERIKALEGDFVIRSEKGKGSTFELTVPYKREFDELDQNEVQKINDKNILFKEAIGELLNEGSVRILVADDHHIVRQSISTVLNGYPSFKVVAEAEDGEDAVRKTLELNPDVVIMDLNMPRLNGIAATKMIHEQRPAVKVIGLSVQDEKTVSDSMKEAGAVAFFHKGTEIDKLIETIKACMVAT